MWVASDVVLDFSWPRIRNGEMLRDDSGPAQDRVIEAPDYYRLLRGHLGSGTTFGHGNEAQAVPRAGASLGK
jgi:hypothetical protein